MRFDPDFNWTGRLFPGMYTPRHINGQIGQLPINPYQQPQAAPQQPPTPPQLDPRVAAHAPMNPMTYGYGPEQVMNPYSQSPAATHVLGADDVGQQPAVQQQPQDLAALMAQFGL